MTRAGGWKLAAALAAFLAPALAPAAGLAALNYDLSLGGSVNYTDNLHLDSDSPGEGQREPVQEMIYAVAPGIELEWSEVRDSLVANYLGQYMTCNGDEDRDAEWIHRLSASLGWRRWEPYFLGAARPTSGSPARRDPAHHADGAVRYVCY